MHSTGYKGPGLQLTSNKDKERSAIVLPSATERAAMGDRLPIGKGGPEPVPAFKPIPPILDRRSGPGRLLDIIFRDERFVIGIMMGTSLDAIDMAFMRCKGRGITADRPELLDHATFEYPTELKRRVKSLLTPATLPADPAERLHLARSTYLAIMRGTWQPPAASQAINERTRLNFLLGEAIAICVNIFRREKKIADNRVDIIGTAGQTIWHNPDIDEFLVDFGGEPHMLSTRSTDAIGEPAVIAQRTGILTIGELRVRDVAAGGHGAPITPFFDWLLLRHETKGRCVQNIGGIGNVTYLPPNAPRERVIAFDTGPGNMIIDELSIIATGGSQACDLDGRLAAEGSIRQDILEGWLAHPYFKALPPKTSGRELFGSQFAKRAIEEHPQVPLTDLIATATELTVQSIARAYRDFILNGENPFHQLILGGGGARNPMIVRGLRREFPEQEVLDHDDIGIPNQMKEPMAVGVIADEGVYGSITNIAGATGGQPAILGKICY